MYILSIYIFANIYICKYLHIGDIVTEDLIPGGQSIPVTRDNVHAFIHRKANYKLNIETSEQSRNDF
jgi:hypothetical protein